MKVLDFNPQPALGVNTNGVNMVMNLLDSNDRSWLTQSTVSVHRTACACGHGFFNAIVEQFEGENKKYIDDQKNALSFICNAVSEFVNKDFDVCYTRCVTKEKTITVDVPKVRKVGFFKTENYIEHETRIEKYTEEERCVYKGWIIERLFRQEGNGSSKETLFFDYCLGANGKLYMVVSHNEDKSAPIEVFECVCYSPAFLRNTFCNVYSSAISGVIGVLDAIPTDCNDSRRNIHIVLDDDYYYNYPIQIDDGHDYPYGFLDGVIIRLINLLDEKGKNECCKKYEKMRRYIFPTEANSSQVQDVDSQFTDNQKSNFISSDDSQNQIIYFVF